MAIGTGKIVPCFVCVCDLFAFIYTGKNIFSLKVEKEKFDSRTIMNSNHSSKYLPHCFPFDSILLFYSIYSSLFYFFDCSFLGCFNHNSFVEFHFDSFFFNVFRLCCIFSTWLFEWKKSRISLFKCHSIFSHEQIFLHSKAAVFIAALFYEMA